MDLNVEKFIVKMVNESPVEMKSLNYKFLTNSPLNENIVQDLNKTPALLNNSTPQNTNNTGWSIWIGLLYCAGFFYSKDQNVHIFPPYKQTIAKGKIYDTKNPVATICVFKIGNPYWSPCDTNSGSSPSRKVSLSPVVGSIITASAISNSPTYWTLVRSLNLNHNLAEICFQVVRMELGLS